MYKIDSSSKLKYMIGIDEVGRGPLAGPVCVAAFAIPISTYEEVMDQALKETDIPIRDSKQLTKLQRIKWYQYLKTKKKEGIFNYSISYMSSAKIDKIGISKCIEKALNRSLSSLGINPVECIVYLDGGLHAKSEYVNQLTVIKGDELYPVISFASIIAKVSRDKRMCNLIKKYPNHGFENNVGYGTKSHYEAIKEHGQTPIHRKSYIHHK